MALASGTVTPLFSDLEGGLRRGGGARTVAVPDDALAGAAGKPLVA
jgi:hypothetical protein